MREARRGRASRKRVARFDRVLLAGGGAAGLAWNSRDLPGEEVSEGERCAEEGGLAILARAGKRGIVVDLGQSALKIAWRDGRIALARDMEAIPPNTGRGRSALVNFVGDALAKVARKSPPEAVVLALPCEVSGEGRLGACSYPWAEGDHVASELLDAAGLARVPTSLVNDAELAAIGVAERGGMPGTSLVLTIGFGVGGALLRW